MVYGQYNITDYGAVADGVTDDTEAINYCIANAVSEISGIYGASIWVPAGTYLIEGEIELFGDLDFNCARNAVFKRGANSQYMFKNFNSSYGPTGYNGRGNISWNGGIFDAQGQTFDTACSIMVFAHCRNIVIRDAQFRNVPDWHAIELSAVSNAIVDNCIFEGFDPVTAGREISEACQIDLPVNSGTLPGIGAASYDNTPCERIRFTNNYMGVATDGSGLGVFGKIFGSHTDVSNIYQKDVIVRSNISTGSLKAAIQAKGWKNVILEGNILRNVADEAAIQLVIGNATAPDNISVKGNIIDGFAESAINIDGTGGSVTRVAIEGNTCENLTAAGNGQPNIALWFATRYNVSDNVVYQADTSGIFLGTCTEGVVSGNRVSDTTTQGLSISTTTRSHFVGNYMLRTGTNGIFISTSSQRNTIMGNSIVGASRTTNNTSSGIHISNSANDRNVIADNWIAKYGSGNEAARGIGFDGSNPANNVIQGNKFSGFGTTYTSVIVLNGASILDDISGTGTANTIQA
jgi:parallel beta-helix repeat protein